MDFTGDERAACGRVSDQGSLASVLRLWKRTLALSVTACIGAGCAVGPDFHRPALPFAMDQYAEQESTGHFTMHSDSIHDWWMELNDPVLTQLITEACLENPGVQEAYSRIAQAGFRSEVAAGAMWPQASTDISYSRRRFAPGSSGQEGRRSGDSFDSFTQTLRASWEIDLFGRLQRQIEAADARHEVAVEDARAVIVSLMADIASSYVELRVLQHRLEIARQNAQVQSGNVDLARNRQKAGLTSLLDVKQAETTVGLTEATIPSLEQRIQQQMNRISTLVGRPPSQEFYAWLGTGPVPQPNRGVVAGIPAKLIQQRPDIRRAEKELHAATAEIGVAEGDLYPQLNLVGSPSFDSSLFSHWYRSQSFGFSVGPSIRWNLFQMGRLLNTVEAQEAARDQAEFRFRETVLRAVEEVESGLIEFRKSHERVIALERASSAAAEAVGLSEATYQVGNTSFQRVIDAQRQLLSAQDQLAQAQGSVTLSWIQTYRALGGGWLDNTGQFADCGPAVDSTIELESSDPLFGAPVPTSEPVPVVPETPDLPVTSASRTAPSVQLNVRPTAWSTQPAPSPLKFKGKPTPIELPSEYVWGHSPQ